MRTQHVLRLLYTIAFCSAITPSFAAPPIVQDANALIKTANPLAQTVKPIPKGTEHAPVDGKDGLPRSGPFIETSGDRERKKNLDDDSLLTPHPENVQSLKDDLLEADIPQSRDGVMNDKLRSGPSDGERGTDGGISIKGKPKTVDVDPKRPGPPKEQPHVPHSDQEMAKEKPLLDKMVDDTKKTFENPQDLPAAGDDYAKSIPSDDHRLKNHPSATRPGMDEIPEDIVQPFHSMFLAFTMILVSEIGDKTFLVACLMAMRHDRLLVFSAAFSALITMTVLSALLGHAVPTLIPKWLTNWAAAGLFLVFGAKMLLEARKISPDEGVTEEMNEVEQELEEKEHEQLRVSRSRSNISPYALESGRGGIGKQRAGNGRLPSPPDSPLSESSSRAASPSRRSTAQNMLAGVNNLCGLLLSPAWVQTFVMTFLGEWGDRSQIATIAMAAGSDYWWVTAGALGGHAICTGVAVIGGKAIAGRVSLRTVTMGGAIAFLAFGVIYLLEAIY